MTSMGVPLVSVECDALGALEFIGAGNHDAIAFLESGDDLDRVETGSTDLDGGAFGDVAAHDIRNAAGARIDERAALDHQDVRMLVDEDARRQLLVLAQANGLLVTEADATGDLVVDHFGRYRADFAAVRPVRITDFGRHADREIVREHFRYLHFDFERAQIDHGQDRRIRGDVRALLHDQLADL